MSLGDIVVLITDGFVEWENERGEQFGTDRLADVIQRFAGQEPEEIIAELYTSVLGFVDGTPQQDDLTAVLIKRPASGVIGQAPNAVLKASAVAAGCIDEKIEARI